MAANGKRDQILLWYLDVICRIILLIWNKLLWLYNRMKWHQNLDLTLSTGLGSWISLLNFCEFAFYFEACKLCLTSCKAEQSSLDSKCCWSCYWNKKMSSPLFTAQERCERVARLFAWWFSTWPSSASLVSWKCWCPSCITQEVFAVFLRVLL